MKKLAILGPAGTYSDLASSSLKEIYEKEFYPSILHTTLAIDEETDALIPFENTLDGFVMESLDLIIKSKYHIVEQVKQDVDFQFVSYADDISQVEKVYVQFKAYGQCLEFMTDHQLTPILTQSNIESLECIKNTPDFSFAAIVPRHIDSSGFSLVLENITDSKQNQTRFVHLSKETSHLEAEEILTCSVTVTPLVDKPGILFSILKKFHDYNINLKAILSRPRKDIMGRYIFYLEFDIKQSALAKLEQIKKELEEKKFGKLDILGIYNRLEEELCEL